MREIKGVTGSNMVHNPHLQYRIWKIKWTLEPVNFKIV